MVSFTFMKILRDLYVCYLLQPKPVSYRNMNQFENHGWTKACILPHSMVEPNLLSNPLNKNEILLIGAEDDTQCYIYNSQQNTFKSIPEIPYKIVQRQRIATKNNVALFKNNNKYQILSWLTNARTPHFLILDLLSLNWIQTSIDISNNITRDSDLSSEHSHFFNDFYNPSILHGVGENQNTSGQLCFFVFFCFFFFFFCK